MTDAIVLAKNALGRKVRCIFYLTYLALCVQIESGSFTFFLTERKKTMARQTIGKWLFKRIKMEMEDITRGVDRTNKRLCPPPMFYDEALWQRWVDHLPGSAVHGKKMYVEIKKEQGWRGRAQYKFIAEDGTVVRFYGNSPKVCGLGRLSLSK